MKQVMLFADSVLEGSFDTIKEAEDYAATRPEFEKFSIYTLFAEGERSGILWQLQTDTAANLIENKKAAAASNGELRKGAWSRLEMDTLTDNWNAGMPVDEIATALKRTYNSVYIKLKGLGLYVNRK